MPTSWDEGLKRLLRESPQDFITWLVRDAIYLNQASAEFYLKLDRHRKVVADAICSCTLHEQSIMVHIEFQSEGDRYMGLRLLEYNVLADREYDCPVISCVIYLLKDSGIIESPLIRMLESGQPIYQFHFQVIELWELRAEDLVQAHLPGILALLPLTKDGRDPAVIEEMIVQLQASEKHEVLSLGYLLASLTWKEDEEQQWLKRRFNMLYDQLRESWAFKEIWQEGEEVGLKKGLEKGRQEGEIAALRKTVLALVEKRFPRLLRLAQGMVSVTSEPATLDQMILGIGVAQTTEEAQRALLESSEDSKN
ncbi:MAG: hypothetical protein M3Z08_23995 [Chloroflexota bacterium]|nr:hypothetical protein [Chloroflexota bacterium]